MKKGILKNVFLWLMIAVMLIFGMEIFREFMANHTYYNKMFADRANRKVVIWALISTLLPVLYLLKSKKFSLWKFTIFLFLWALLFWFINLWIKKSFITSWAIIYIINELLLFTLWAWFLVWTLAFWTRLSKLIFKFKENRIQEMFLNFWIWLWALMILWQTLIWFGLFHPVVSWIIFLGLWFLVWYERLSMKEYSNMLWESINSLNNNWWYSLWKYVLLALVIFSLVYYLYWFQLSFIPYSTAWDANHEYMYVTKVIAENNWLIWWNMWTASSMPYLWHTFISFWFSIGSVFSGNWLSPDTIAVAMNFLSWPLCLIFGLLLVKEVLDFFISKKDEENENIKWVSFATWWATLLLWLCSGMWAFLVFVDNKTDLWVMAITILAMLSWFIFIRYIAEHKWKWIIDKESVKYLVVSWIFFSLACMSKPTAFIDVAIFGILLCALRLNSFVWLWVGIMWLGFMWILKPLTAAEMMTESLWKWLILIWLIIAIFGVVMMFIMKDEEWKKYKSLFSYIVIWAATFVCSLIVFKWPWLAYSQVISNDFSIWNRWKGLIMSYDNEEWKIKNVERSEIPQSGEKWRKILLATTEEYLDLESQNEIDREYLESLVEWENNLLDSSLRSEWQISEWKDIITPEQCLSTKYSAEELEDWLKEAPVSNEDLWRYVWYWWKEFSNRKRVSYNLLRIFYPKDGKCYWVNSDAKILCKNQAAIEKWDINVIKNLDLKEWSPAYEILESWLIAYNENPDTLMDLITNLKTYYQNHVIYTADWKMYIPYRYVVPLNIVFNRSLQNLSSYYTDIWFVWMFIFVFLIFSFIYSIIKKDRKLFAVSMATVIWWSIWRVIWSAILWYWVGLLMWTALVMAMYIQDILSWSKKWISIVWALTLGLFGLFILLQFFFNFIRIASQWSSGPFLWFKQSVWEEQVIGDDLTSKTDIKIWYSQKDVFDLQFPQYNQFIEYVKDRNDEDWVLIAWTYLQYFLDNQKNIFNDWSLTRFWEQWSDWDTCKMYWRLKNKNLKYLVIDPNIASIVMWEWNKSLYYRFFAKTNDNWKIIEKWALMMLAELIDEWYAKLLYSNNLWATYWFTLSDEDLQAVFGQKSKEELIYLRTQLAAARYMDNANELVNWIRNIFNSRIQKWEVVQDIADVYWKDIELWKVLNAMNVYLSNRNSLPQMASTLTQDEKIMLIQFMNLYSLSQNPNSSQYQEFVNNIFMNSIAWWSQLIVVELL